MLRTVYMPDSNCITVPIPDRYIGTELEILIFPIKEILTPTVVNSKKSLEVDASFGGWADMDKTTEEICSEIRESRAFRDRNFVMQ